MLFLIDGPHWPPWECDVVTVIQGQASTDLAGSPPPSAPPITRVPTAGSPSEQQPEWQPPVTIQRVKHCRDSAERWAKILPWYANTMQRRADAWAMAAGIIAAVTGVAIWPVISDTSSAWEKAIVSAGALAAAVCALPPRIKNHGEWAARARAIAGRYGEIGGELEDLQAAVLSSSCRLSYAPHQYQKLRKFETALHSAVYGCHPWNPYASQLFVGMPPALKLCETKLVQSLDSDEYAGFRHWMPLHDHLSAYATAALRLYVYVVANAAWLWPLFVGDLLPYADWLRRLWFRGWI